MSSRTFPFARATRRGAVVAVASLALTACGGAGDDQTSARDDKDVAAISSDSTAKVTGDPIKIGYAASLSGAQAVNGVAAKAVAHAWQEYTNTHGGILGHPVEVEVVDTKNTVPGATSVAKTFMQDKDVDAIFLTDLVAEGSMASLFEGTDVPIISGGGSSDLLWSEVPGVFQDVSGADYALKTYVDLVKAADSKKFGWAGCAEVAVCQANAELAGPYGETLDMSYTGGQSISSSASDYTAQCLAFIGDGTDGIALNIGYGTGTRFASDCIQQGYTGTFSVMNSGFDQTEFGKIAGFKSAGSTNGFPWWADAPVVSTYRGAMKKFSPDGVYSSGNSTAIWSSFELFKKALENAKPSTVDRTSAMEAMYTVKDETLDGLLPEPITFTKGQPSTPVGCSWFFNFDAGDENPTAIAPDKSGNGAAGDLASTCAGYLPKK
ncbi:ABC transporter substrate-binding protein [Nocardioides sp. NPDC101246]|uniref:ABC transporter substrate-binding protein n=1 Tax=Nocardioides sp. NPDC101246 TaxID=3364336 RepID=UPI00382A13BA